MSQRKGIIAAAIIVAGAAVFVSALQAQADKPGAPKPGAVATAGKEVTLTGKIVDIYCFMTEKFPSADHRRAVQMCLRNGVPAVLETEDGIVIVGGGPKGARRELAPLALQTVELKGKLYERHGVRYVDMISIKPAKGETVEEADDEEWEPGEDEEAPKPESPSPSTPDPDDFDE